MLDRQVLIPVPAMYGSRRHAFTLIELLVVMTIIILMTLASIPAIRFITGSRSTEGATNIVSAFLGRARSDAIQSNQTRGVFFFYDPDTDLTTMALVRQGDSDPTAKEYLVWTDGKLEYHYPQMTYGTIQYWKQDDLVPPITGGAVMASAVTAVVSETKLVHPNTSSTRDYRSWASVQWIPQPYICSVSHTAGQVYNSAADTFNNSTALGLGSPNPPTAAYWKATGDRYLEQVPGTEFVTLPPGVALQVLNDPTLFPSNPERYLRSSCILFDSNGQFQSVPWAVSTNSTLGGRLKLNPSGAGLDLLNGSTPALLSGIGVVLYDRGVFKASPGATAAFTENDYVFKNAFLTTSNDPANITAEQNEETWLDNNTLPLVINRINGTLIKGE